MRALYNKHIYKQTRLSIDEILDAPNRVAASYSRIFILVDALDEYQNGDGDRTTFLSGMLNLQTQSGINVLATSRFLPDLDQFFDRALHLEIRASEEDVRLFLDERVRHMRSFVLRNEALQEQIKNDITASVDGM